jgi:hypothetical protein
LVYGRKHAVARCSYRRQRINCQNNQPGRRGHRYPDGSRQGGDPTADTWTSAGYKLVDFLASDTLVANSLSSGQAQLIVSGQEVDWAFDSPWAKKQPDNRADPKVKLTLSVSNVYVTTPQDIQSNANITSTVNNATTFWWKKAKIQLNWNGTISAVKSCDPVLYPSGCGANPLLDIAEINSSTTATQFVRRLCTAGQVPKCTSSGSQLVFNQDQGSLKPHLLLHHFHISPGDQT